MSLAYTDSTASDVLSAGELVVVGDSSDGKGHGRSFGDAAAEGDAENHSLAPRWVPSSCGGEVGSTEPVNRKGFHAAKQLESPLARKQL